MHGGGSSGVGELSDLSDVDTSGASDGDVLTYDSVNGWTAEAPTGGGGDSTGLQTIPVNAQAMHPTLANGCSALQQLEIDSSQPNLLSLVFSTSVEESCDFNIMMPQKWAAGTVTFRFVWSHPSTTVNYGVRWSAKAAAIGNGDALGATYGTAQAVSDTGGSTNTLYISDATPALTIGGSPARGDMVCVRVSRVVSHGDDNLDASVRLHAVLMDVTVDAGNDEP